MKLIIGFAMFGNQLTLWNLLKIVMSELYKRFLCVEAANKLKSQKVLKREGKKTFFLNFEKTNFFLVWRLRQTH